MKNEKLGSETAFPTASRTEYGYILTKHEGMSKRFYAACAAMQGMFANSEYNITAEQARYFAKIALIASDELLTQENE